MNTSFFKKCLLVTLTAAYGSLLAQNIFEPKDIVYLYDSSTSGYSGLEADLFYAMVCENVPDDLNVIPVEMADVDSKGLNSLDRTAGIIISDTGNDRGEDDPLVTKLGELYNTHPMLCLNTTFPTRWVFYGLRPAYFEVKRDVPGNYIYQTYFEYQMSIFDDMLASANGLTSIYDPSVEGKYNLAVADFEDVTHAFAVLGTADIENSGDFGLTDSGLALLGGSRFLYLGLCQSLMGHLTVTGKNLVRNAVQYLIDGDYYAHKPRLTGLVVNGIAAPADVMCELSTGEATLHLPSQGEWDGIRDIKYNFVYASGCRQSYSNRFTYFELKCEYGNKQDIYKVHYVFDSQSGIDELTFDQEDVPSYDLQGRKLQEAKGLSIEGGRIVFRQ